LRKPLLVLRKVTERPEASLQGLAKVVGTLREEIVMEASRVLSDEALYRRMSSGSNPYGDGRASARIAEALARWGRHEQTLLPLESQFLTTPVPEFAAAAPTPRQVEMTCQ
jgi:UDP-N-acetylglucosamine 2-epimerase (non-hydrolysing)